MGRADKLSSYFTTYNNLENRTLISVVQFFGNPFQLPFTKYSAKAKHYAKNILKKCSFKHYFKNLAQRQKNVQEPPEWQQVTWVWRSQKTAVMTKFCCYIKINLKNLNIFVKKHIWMTDILPTYHFQLYMGFEVLVSMYFFNANFVDTGVNKPCWSKMCDRYLLFDLGHRMEKWAYQKSLQFTQD